MAADFLYPTLEIANEGKEIAMAVQYKPSVVADLQIKIFGPIDLNENTCSVTKGDRTIPLKTPNDVAQTLKPLGSIAINCTRQSKATQINGVNYNCTNETIFTVATSSPVKAIKIPRVCSEVIQESRADRIERKLDEALKQIKDNAKDNAVKAQEKVDGLRDRVNTTLKNLRSFDPGTGDLGFDTDDPSKQTKSCGNGQLVARVQSYSEDNHKKMAFLCKSLKELQVPVN
jgi:hypothetical protein